MNSNAVMTLTITLPTLGVLLLVFSAWLVATRRRRSLSTARLLGGYALIIPFGFIALGLAVEMLKPHISMHARGGALLALLLGSILWAPPLLIGIFLALGYSISSQRTRAHTFTERFGLTPGRLFGGMLLVVPSSAFVLSMLMQIFDPSLDGNGRDFAIVTLLICSVGWGPMLGYGLFLLRGNRYSKSKVSSPVVLPCPKCGVPPTGGDRFCQGCGATLT